MNNPTYVQHETHGAAESKPGILRFAFRWLFILAVVLGIPTLGYLDYMESKTTVDDRVGEWGEFYKMANRALEFGTPDGLERQLDVFRTVRNELPLYAQRQFVDVQRRIELVYFNNMLAKVKALPASDTCGNYDGYVKLSKMQPDNAALKDKVAQYSGCVAIREQREREHIATQKLKRQWEDAQRALEYSIEDAFKKIARDPESVEVEGCGRITRASDVVGTAQCVIRGRNGFGGMNRSVYTVTVSRAGAIIGIK